MYVDLVQKGGAEIILVPSAFTVPTGRAHWHVLLRGTCRRGGNTALMTIAGNVLFDLIYSVQLGL